MNKIFARAFFLLISLIPVVAYGNYTVTPVKVHIMLGSTMASLTIQNNNEDDRYFQIRIYRADKDNKEHSAEETKDLVVSPAMFKAVGKKGQIIRVAVKNPDAAFKQKHYVMSIKELPHGKEEMNTVKLVTDLRVPILVGEAEEEKEAEKKY
jgi:P pilus assembly chaperone PapD